MSESGRKIINIIIAIVVAIGVAADGTRQVLGFADANSTEFDPDTAHPVIDLMPEQQDVTDLGGTMRLGAWPCVLKPDTLAARLYGTEQISERHRHRYEVNNDFRQAIADAGVTFCGLSPDGRLVEASELSDRPFFLGVQYHPEFKSRPTKAHPLFYGFVEASLAQSKGEK